MTPTGRTRRRARRGLTLRRRGPLVVAALAACTAGGEPGSGTGSLVVLAASSLARPMPGLVRAFERAHPGIEVQTSFAASSALREQVLAGVPAGVFASAAPEHVERVVEAGAAAGPAVVFATNRMVLGVPAGNPGRVRDVADLARDELLVGLCAEEVPCGRYARRILARAGVTPAVDTVEPSVGALVTRIETGEIDAGVVYATDAAGSARIEAVAIPDELAETATYAVVPLAGAPDPATAAAFVAFLTSAEARRVLARHGFGPP